MKKCPYCAEEIQDEAVVCRYCGRELAPTAPPTPAPTPKPTKKTVNLVGIITLTLIILCILVGVISSLNNRPGGVTTRPTPTSDEKLEAAYACEQFVTRSLKAPKTAEFQHLHDAGVYQLGDKTQYRVNAYVDSENSFGAMIRTEYSCVVQREPSGDWRLVDLKTEP